MNETISRKELSEVGLTILKDANDGMRRAEKSGSGALYDFHKGRSVAVASLLKHFLIKEVIK